MLVIKVMQLKNFFLSLCDFFYYYYYKESSVQWKCSMDVNCSSWNHTCQRRIFIFKTKTVETLFKISSFVLSRRKKVIQVSNSTQMMTEVSCLGELFNTR